MKQAILTIGGLAVAAGILVGMVIYTVTVMREAEMRILTGDLSPISADELWNLSLLTEE